MWLLPEPQAGLPLGSFPGFPNLASKWPKEEGGATPHPWEAFEPVLNQGPTQLPGGPDTAGLPDP